MIIETSSDDKIICPYCGVTYSSDAWEYGDCDGEDFECDDCGGRFMVV